MKRDRRRREPPPASRTRSRRTGHPRVGRAEHRAPSPARISAEGDAAQCRAWWRRPTAAPGSRRRRSRRRRRRAPATATARARQAQHQDPRRHRRQRGKAGTLAPRRRGRRSRPAGGRRSRSRAVHTGQRGATRRGHQRACGDENRVDAAKSGGTSPATRRCRGTSIPRSTSKTVTSAVHVFVRRSNPLANKRVRRQEGDPTARAPSRRRTARSGRSAHPSRAAPRSDSAITPIFGWAKVIVKTTVNPMAPPPATSTSATGTAPPGRRPPPRAGSPWTARAGSRCEAQRLEHAEARRPPESSPRAPRGR